MGETRAQQIQRISEEALSLAGAERETFIVEACGLDDELRSDVLRVIRGEAEQPTIVEMGSQVTATLPKNIGRYRIRRVLGSGGMGTVFEALQDKPRRKVAVKVMRTGVTSPKAARRFEYESQILGRLSHSGIAQVYEAGTYDDGSGGVPYFAMEYIAGAKTILEYVHERRPSRDEMIGMFCKVCDAVHHGHTKGIIHRDLKPGNVLVDREGDPRIIDFGVARATDSDMAVTTLQTEVGQLIGTVQYMSPEQCEADPDILDTRSDVYALGIMLYELLTGRLPYDLKTVPLYEAASIIREGTPSKLSTIDRGLRGDLETIVAKAIEKDRERRYQSALELKQDLERFLRGDPIEARPPSIAYQLQLLARRNRGLLVTIVIIMLVMAGATIWSLLERTRALEAESQTAEALVQAESARDQAELEARRTARVSGFLQHIISMVSPKVAQGEVLTMNQILDRAAASVDDRFGEFPLVEAQVRETLGQIYLDLGLLPQAEQNIREAITLREGFADGSDQQLLSAKIRLAEIMVISDRLVEADKMTSMLLETTRDALGEDSLVTLDAMEIRRDTLEKRGLHFDVAPLAKQVLEGYQRVLGPEHELTYRARLAVLGSDLMMYVISSEKQPGNAVLTELQTRTAALADEMTFKLGGRHPVTLQVIAIDGSLAFFAFDYPLAQQKLAGVVEDCRAVLGSTHPKTLEAMRLLGMISLAAGGTADAEPLLTEALEGYEQTTGLDSLSALSTSAALATVYQLEGDYERAIELSAGPYDMLMKVAGPYSEHTFMARSVYGRALALSGRVKEGRPLLELTVKMLSAMPPGSGGTKRALSHRLVLAMGLIQSDDPAQWKEGLEMVATDYQQARESPEVDDGFAMTMLAKGIGVAVTAGRREGLLELARPMHELAISLSEPGEDAAAAGTAAQQQERLELAGMGLVFLAGEPGYDEQIEPLVVDVRRRMNDTMGQSTRGAIEMARAQVLVQGRLGRVAEARTLARQTLPVAEQALGADHELVVELREWLAAHP